MPKIRPVTLGEKGAACTTIISTWVSHKLDQRLRRLAESARLPLSTFIRKALEAYADAVDENKESGR